MHHHGGFFHAAGLGKKRYSYSCIRKMFTLSFFHMTMRLMGAVLITHAIIIFENNFVLFFPAGAHVLYVVAH